jgi:glycosyltransferase involved in cell wall biosynthesis
MWDWQNFELYRSIFVAIKTESFGLAALEAMAWSVPVISSNSGGLGGELWGFQAI